MQKAKQMLPEAPSARHAEPHCASWAVLSCGPGQLCRRRNRARAPPAVTRTASGAAVSTPGQAWPAGRNWLPTQYLSVKMGDWKINRNVSTPESRLHRAPLNCSGCKDWDQASWVWPCLAGQQRFKWIQSTYPRQRLGRATAPRSQAVRGSPGRTWRHSEAMLYNGLMDRAAYVNFENSFFWLHNIILAFYLLSFYFIMK